MTLTSDKGKEGMEGGGGVDRGTEKGTEIWTKVGVGIGVGPGSGVGVCVFCCVGSSSFKRASPTYALHLVHLPE